MSAKIERGLSDSYHLQKWLKTTGILDPGDLISSSELSGFLCAVANAQVLFAKPSVWPTPREDGI